MVVDVCQAVNKFWSPVHICNNCLVYVLMV